jgi:steroid delta-isomerase-like uncharacterized protein
MQPQNHEFIYRQVIDAINNNDMAALDALLAEQMIDHNPIPGQAPGRSGFKEWMASARTSFPDLHGTIEEVLAASGERVDGRVTWHGTQHGPFAGLPPTHKVVALPVMHIVRFEAGTIVEWWGIADIFGAVMWLGGRVVPA